jgi:hypothetical protein
VGLITNGEVGGAEVNYRRPHSQYLILTAYLQNNKVNLLSQVHTFLPSTYLLNSFTWLVVGREYSLRWGISHVTFRRYEAGMKGMPFWYVSVHLNSTFLSTLSTSMRWYPCHYKRDAV